VSVCLLNSDTSAYHSLLARGQQVVLEQTDHLYRTTTKNKRYRVTSEQMIIEQECIKYSYGYMFRPYGVIIRVTFRTYYKKYTYCVVEVRSEFLQICFIK
jgi:hypothetical protein